MAQGVSVMISSTACGGRWEMLLTCVSNDLLVSHVMEMVPVPVAVDVEPRGAPQNVDAVKLVVYLEHAEKAAIGVVWYSQPRVRISVDLDEHLAINGEPLAICTRKG